MSDCIASGLLEIDCSDTTAMMIALLQTLNNLVLFLPEIPLPLIASYSHAPFA